MKSAMVFLLAAACVITIPVCAKEKYRDVVNAPSEDAFAQLADSVLQDMAAAGRYEFVTPVERATIEKNFNDMTALFHNRGSVDKMSEPQKVELFNSQEVINSILTKRDSERVICENKIPIGSHIPKTFCHTYGQEQEARRGTDREVFNLKKVQCVGAHCSSN